MAYPFLPVNPCCTDVVINDPCGCSSTITNSGCNSNDPCSTNLTASSTIAYDGPALSCIIAEPCDTLNVILQKIDEIICNLLTQINILTIQVNNITTQIINIEGDIINIDNSLDACCNTTTSTTTTAPIPCQGFSLNNTSGDPVAIIVVDCATGLQTAIILPPGESNVCVDTGSPISVPVTIIVTPTGPCTPINCTFTGTAEEIASTTTTTTTVALDCEFTGSATEVTTTTTTTAVPTTTTTSSSTSSTTTTTTTAVPTTTTTTTGCVRPGGLVTVSYFNTYTYDDIQVDYTGSLLDACNACNFIKNNIIDIQQETSLFGQSVSFNIGQYVYAGTGTSCNALADGFYITDHEFCQITEILNEEIESITNCEIIPITTTTTTTGIPCDCLTFNNTDDKNPHSIGYIDCNNVPVIDTNIEPLALVKLCGSNGLASNPLVTITVGDACIDSVCPELTTTTTTTACVQWIYDTTLIEPQSTVVTLAYTECITGTPITITQPAGDFPQPFEFCAVPYPSIELGTLISSGPCSTTTTTSTTCNPGESHLFSFEPITTTTFYPIEDLSLNGACANWVCLDPGTGGGCEVTGGAPGGYINSATPTLGDIIYQSNIGCTLSSIPDGYYAVDVNNTFTYIVIQIFNSTIVGLPICTTTTTTTTVEPTTTTTTTVEPTTTTTTTVEPTTTTTTTIEPTTTTTTTIEPTTTSTTTSTPSPQCYNVEVYPPIFNPGTFHTVEYLDCLGDPQTVNVPDGGTMVPICATIIVSNNNNGTTTTVGICTA
jgi:hypothetical protein